jgi:hypothetical protein
MGVMALFWKFLWIICTVENGKGVLRRLRMLDLRVVIIRMMRNRMLRGGGESDEKPMLVRRKSGKLLGVLDIIVSVALVPLRGQRVRLEIEDIADETITLHHRSRIILMTRHYILLEIDRYLLGGGGENN